MIDSESDDEQTPQAFDHVVGPVEDAWKMKIPEFKPNDNRHGKILNYYKKVILNFQFSHRSS